jgi:hypothetical protein
LSRGDFSHFNHHGGTCELVGETSVAIFRLAEENRGKFERIEAKLDGLRSYLYANRQSLVGHAEAYRNGGRVSSANMESTVNRLTNWRMCKKQQMGFEQERSILPYVKTGAINGRLERYTGLTHRQPISLPDAPMLLPVSN